MFLPKFYANSCGTQRTTGLYQNTFVKKKQAISKSLEINNNNVPVQHNCATKNKAKKKEEKQTIVHHTNYV